MISLEKEGLAQWRSPTSIVVVLESVNWLHRLFDYDNDKRCADNDHEGGLCTADDSRFTKKGLCHSKHRPRGYRWSLSRVRYGLSKGTVRPASEATSANDNARP